MKRLFAFFKRLVCGPPPMKRSLYLGERLTDDEALFIMEQMLCPDCFGELHMGPAGGASRNLLCWCGSNYNVVEPGLGIAGGERISDSSRLNLLEEPDEQQDDAGVPALRVHPGRRADDGAEDLPESPLE